MTEESGSSGPSPPREDLDRAADIVVGMGDATFLRGAAAILLGFAVLTMGSVAAGRAILWITGAGPEAASDSGFLAINLGSKLLVAVLAGALTAKAAPKAPAAHALALAAALTLFGLAGLAGLRAGGGLMGPAWYPAAMTFIGPAGVLIGGLMMTARARPQSR